LFREWSEADFPKHNKNRYITRKVPNKYQIYHGLDHYQLFREWSGADFPKPSTLFREWNICRVGSALPTLHEMVFD